MRALIVKDNKLILDQIADPKPGPEDVLIEVKAFGLNHADILQRKGQYPPPPGVSTILGLEVAGIVEQVGSHESEFKKGDRVMCLLPGGGYAEKVAVHQARCMPIPHHLSFEQAAAIPEVFLAAYQSLFTIGELQPLQWVLIHAAGSGVGTAAIQLARAADAKTIATSRTKDKLEKCLELGANAVINTSDGKFAKKVHEVTDGHGADLILDFIGAAYFAENMEALAIGGAMISIATLSGGTIEKFDLRLLMKKWATLSGTTLRNRPIEFIEKLIKEFTHFAFPRFEQGILKPIIHSTLSWNQGEQGHEKLTQSQAFGKIVLIVD
ncbi:MAG: NAD(P)H-quinone oxidoreductase [Verrucomicrobia bacterium]|nr:NAD(P)H-quinone oxidoreductase [Verrucomicrobiota bacterium]